MQQRLLQGPLWRTSGVSKRYSFFAKVNLPIITCHHLDDAVESWVFTSMHGNPFLIPHKRDNFIRPFLITEKSELSYWAITKNVPYISDPSNNETKYQRNYIRHKMMPHVLRINPGIKKTIKKKYLASTRGCTIMEHLTNCHGEWAFYLLCCLAYLL